MAFSLQSYVGEDGTRNSAVFIVCAQRPDNDGREDEKVRIIPCAALACCSRCGGGRVGLVRTFAGGAHLREVRWKSSR